MRRGLFLCLCVGSLSSCSMYQNRFDSPAHLGVGCYSVTEIESMIVEKEKGEDLFCPPFNRTSKAGRKCHTRHSRCRKHSGKTEASVNESHTSQSSHKVCREDPLLWGKDRRRIWVAAQTKEDGTVIGSHYIYFSEEEE